MIYVWIGGLIVLAAAFDQYSDAKLRDDKVVMSVWKRIGFVAVCVLIGSLFF